MAGLFGSNDHLAVFFTKCYKLLIQLVTVLKFLSSLQQVPDEIERVLVGIPAYLSMRKHSSSSGLNIFYNGESENSLAEKVWFSLEFFKFLYLICVSYPSQFVLVDVMAYA